jgi:hypothetical protein
MVLQTENRHRILQAKRPRLSGGKQEAPVQVIPDAALCAANNIAQNFVLIAFSTNLAFLPTFKIGETARQYSNFGPLTVGFFRC